MIFSLVQSPNLSPKVKINYWHFFCFLLFLGVNRNTVSQPSAGHLEIQIATGIMGKPVVLGKNTVNTGFTLLFPSKVSYLIYYSEICN